MRVIVEEICVRIAKLHHPIQRDASKRRTDDAGHTSHQADHHGADAFRLEHVKINKEDIAKGGEAGGNEDGNGLPEDGQNECGGTNHAEQIV